MLATTPHLDNGAPVDADDEGPDDDDDDGILHRSNVSAAIKSALDLMRTRIISGNPRDVVGVVLYDTVRAKGLEGELSKPGVYLLLEPQVIQATNIKLLMETLEGGDFLRYPPDRACCRFLRADDPSIPLHLHDGVRRSRERPSIIPEALRSYRLLRAEHAAHRCHAFLRDASQKPVRACFSSVTLVYCCEIVLDAPSLQSTSQLGQPLESRPVSLHRQGRSVPRQSNAAERRTRICKCASFLPAYRLGGTLRVALLVAGTASH